MLSVPSASMATDTLHISEYFFSSIGTVSEVVITTTGGGAEGKNFCIGLCGFRVKKRHTVYEIIAPLVISDAGIYNTLDLLPRRQ